MRDLEKFLELSPRMKIEIVLYPVFLFYRMPLAWIKSLWKARILLNGQWSRYMGFHPHNSINSFFYRTQWINLDRYGRRGISPVIGLGKYPLRNWFHLSLPASYVYANAGAVTTLLSTLLWIFSHLVWLETTQTWWVLAVTVVLFFSSTSYAMAFARQNYQMLGWVWFPVALFFSNDGLYVLATFSWFAAGMAGLTPVFFAFPIVLTISFVKQDPLLMLVILPALLCAMLRVLPLLTHGGLNQAFSNTMKMIGLTKKKVKYDRVMNRLSVSSMYFIGLYLISAFLLSVTLQEIAILPTLAFFLFLINQCFFRVADIQSLIVVVSSLFTFTVLQAEPSWPLLFVLWLVLNPMGFFLSIQRLKKGNINCEIIINPPFDHTDLKAGVESFLEAVPSGARVYFAFEDPRGQYFNIFDGYRVIYELPLLVASERQLHLLPDWWAVYETNFQGAPNCWGRSVEVVIQNCVNWDAQFAIIYQNSGSQLADEWYVEFDILAEFDWCKHLDMFKGNSPVEIGKQVPKWFLLKKR